MNLRTRRAGRPAGRRRALVLRVLGAVLAVYAFAGCGTSAGTAGQGGKATASRAVPPVRALAARPAPAGWRHAALPGGQAVLAFPATMHLVPGDRGTVTAARLAASGVYLMYLNATPRQGTESLRNWPVFRVNHLLDDDASAAHLLGESRDVRFMGGTGSCIVDDYVTRAKAHKYTELACLVKGHTSATVIVAAAPTALWARVSSVLTRAVGAYQTR